MNTVFSFHSCYGRPSLYSYTHTHTLHKTLLSNQGGLALQSCPINPSHTYTHIFSTAKDLSATCVWDWERLMLASQKSTVWIDYYDDNNPHNCINYCRKGEIFITMVLEAAGTQPQLSYWLNFTLPDPHCLIWSSMARLVTSAQLQRYRYSAAACLVEKADIHIGRGQVSKIG